MPSKPDDRATTLKKIDEIEAQMSMQWWKTKHGDSSRGGSSTNFPMSSQMPMDTAASGRPAAPPLRSTAYTKTAPQAMKEEKTHPVELAPAPMLDSVRPGEPLSSGSVAPAADGFAPAGTAPARSVVPGSARPSGVGPSFMATPATGASSQPGASTGFSPSKLFAIDVEEFAHDPELEEASIRFANGDNAGAEAGLMEVLGPKGSRVDHDDTWLTLFDLYRATGQQDRFETAAIDFAGRFGRSAPQWFSLPEAVALMQAPAANAAESSAHAANWTCPATLGTQTIVAMNAALGKAHQPWRLNWSKLNTLDEAAVEPLTKLFTQWAAQSVQLRFMGSDTLEKVLKNATPSSDKGVNPALWKLRMEVLRVMHRPDEFELVALDYCVTYEVSPPSWESARCEYKPLQADGSYVPGQTIVGEAFRDSLSSGLGYGDTNIIGAMSQMSNISTVELSGQILGDASEPLGKLDSKLEGADVMVISCARLIRIDFSAAGTLLNWVTSRQAEGRQVQFIEVHRLVAAFFNVIGISEHARVMARTD
jgi:ABC-type transporter Mla MlaB component